MRHYSFKPGWAASFGCLVLTVLFVSLGQWQLRRADEKAAIMAAHASKTGEPAVVYTGQPPLTDAERFSHLALTGTWDTAHQFLLDNQIHQGQAGYHVLTPVTLNGGSVHILVNRGWIPLGPTRETLPDLTISHPQANITGRVERFPAVGMKLAGGEIPSAGWPARVQRLERGPLESRLGYTIDNWQILLDPAVSEGYARDWQQPDLAPDKSRAYALQWFLFALVAAGLYVWHGFRAGRRAS